jgi:hypothetical protein
MSTTLVEIDKRLFVRWENADFAEPVLHVNYWPTGVYAPEFKFNYGMELPCALKDLGNGCYQVTLEGYGQGPVARLTDGGATKSTKYEQIPIPCPKVRKGIQTRYEHGYWRKYLKSEGWVIA